MPGASGDGNIAVRTTSDPENMVDLLWEETQSEGPLVRVGNVTTQARLVNGTIAQDRMLAQLSGFLALAATILVSVGLYGLTAFDVSRRRSEIGVRIALGRNIEMSCGWSGEGRWDGSEQVWLWDWLHLSH